MKLALAERQQELRSIFTLRYVIVRGQILSWIWFPCVRTPNSVLIPLKTCTFKSDQYNFAEPSSIKIAKKLSCKVDHSGYNSVLHALAGGREPINKLDLPVLHDEAYECVNS